MKIINIILKIILCLLLSTPILGMTGVFPPPTPDLYNTPEAFAFIELLTAGDANYIGFIQAFVFLIAIILIITKRTALAALLILPITVNIIGFHTFLDGGLLTSGALLANILALVNIYFLWQNRKQYKNLLDKSAV